MFRDEELRVPEVNYLGFTQKCIIQCLYFRFRATYEGLAEAATSAQGQVRKEAVLQVPAVSKENMFFPQVTELWLNAVKQVL